MRKLLATLLLVVFTMITPAQFTLENVVYANVNGSVADSYPNENPTEPKTSQSTTELVGGEATKIGFLDYFKLIISLIFVISLLYIFLRFINKKNQMFGSHDLVKNLGGSPLGGNRSIQILKIGEKLYILGVGENVQLLKEIEDEIEVEALVTLYNEKMDTMFKADSILEKAFQLKDKLRESKVKSTGQGEGFKEIFQKQVHDLNHKRNDLFKSLEEKAKDESR